jgi:predicted DNA-binding protein (UPF0278 family)
MNNLKTKIQNNLYLKIDFNHSFQTKSGILTKEPQFFIVGALPVFICYQDGKGERANINRHIKVPKDPMLRSLQGMKVGNFEDIKEYKKKIEEIISKLEKAYSKILKSGKFNKKAIKDIYIINTENHGKKGGNKNRRN